MSVYELGSLVRIGPESFYNILGALADPSTVSLSIKKPDGTIAGPFTYAGAQVVKESTGVYHYDYNPTTVGQYLVKWTSTGTGQAAHVTEFDVIDTLSTGGPIVSVSQVRTHMTVGTEVTDDELQRFIDAATVAVERWIGPVVPRTVVETSYGNARAGTILLQQYPVISITSVTEGDLGSTAAAVDTTGFELDTAASALLRIGSWFGDRVTVTYVAGRAVVGEHIRKATLNHILNEVRRVKSSGTSTFGEAGFTTAPEGLDNLVRNDLMLDPYFRGSTVA